MVFGQAFDRAPGVQVPRERVRRAGRIWDAGRGLGSSGMGSGLVGCVLDLGYPIFIIFIFLLIKIKSF